MKNENESENKHPIEDTHADEKKKESRKSSVSQKDSNAAPDAKEGSKTDPHSKKGSKVDQHSKKDSKKDQHPKKGSKTDQHSKKGSKKKMKDSCKKKKGEEADNDEEFIQLPSCQHAYCLGEVLKNAGIEPGVCRPRPLPWALTGKLLYLPGWEKECRDYKLQQVCYEVGPKKRNADQERYANEVKEARILWSFLEPGLLYPRKPVYGGPEPGVMCECKAGTCKREPPEKEPPEEDPSEEES